MSERKDIKGFEGLYQINNIGEVFSLARFDKTGYKFLSFRKLIPLIRNGYEYVVLFGQDEKIDIAIHRLMCINFLGNPENKPFVNHKDGIRNNNKIENLEWATSKENAQHSHDTGLQIAAKNETHYKSMPVLQYNKDGTFVKEYPCVSEAVRQLNLSTHTCICRCANGERKSAHGFLWELKN